MDVEVRIKLVDGGKLPRRMSAGAVGFDLFARLPEPLVLKPGQRALVPVGFAIEVPSGYEAQIRPRSGLAVRTGLVVLNSPGTVDPDYRGEVKVPVANFGDEPVVIRDGDRIAQMVLAPVASARLVPTEKLSPTKRGEGGFGSTGIR